MASSNGGRLDEVVRPTQRGAVDTEVLGFIFTEKCNFRCRHCCNESHPQALLVMDVAEIAQYIQEAAGTGRLKEIGISGGEPFLYPTRRPSPKVTAIAAISTSYTGSGRRWTCTTCPPCTS